VLQDPDPDSDPDLDIDSDVPPLKFIALIVDGEKGKNTWFLWKVSFAGGGEEVDNKIGDGDFVGEAVVISTCKTEHVEMIL